MDRREVLSRTEEYVRDMLSVDSSGHDWWHVHRVRRMALWLAAAEGADPYVVELTALLHDISDYKLNGGDETKGQQTAYNWLIGLGEPAARAGAVADIIAEMSFKGAGVRSTMPTLEGKVVQDADRLDAVGAIGVARAFAYGGYAGQPMHDPDHRPRLHASREEYRQRHGTTIAHFHEKLLLLKDRMNTASARRLAEHRHEVISEFLREFLAEWDGADMVAVRRLPADQ